MFPRVLDLNNNLIAVLQKAHNIGYTKIKNNLWTAQFTMPLKDRKNVHIKPKYFVEIYDHDRYIGKFIVNPKQTVKNESTNEITYQLEHVLSTLHSDVLFKYHQFTNYTTREVLLELMKQQEVKHWKLGTTAITRYFHYAWENDDSLLNAIFSVPKSFDVPYLFTWDDSVYPFELNLVEPDDTVKDVIASGKNLKGITVDEDPTNIVTRIYPLGAGEGVNQLTIEDVNNGVPYLEDAAAIAEYGIHKRIWPDNRFEDATSLMASGRVILDKFKKPLKSIAIDCRDYTLYERKRKRELMSEYEVGQVLLVHDQDTNTHEEIRLEKIVKSDVYGAPQNIQFELGNVFEDISTTFTDLQKKQLVNDTYSQGATNILSFNYQDNCDSNISALIPFYVDDDVVNINTCELTYRTKKFRAYSQATEGGGAVVKSTGGGGGTNITSGGGGGTSISSGGGGGDTVTSGGGGGTSTTTQSGGGSTPTSSSNGTHRHRVAGWSGNYGQVPPADNWQHFSAPRASDGSAAGVLFIAGAAGDIYTQTADGAHSHTVSVPNHSHNLTLNSHTHSITLNNHTHSITLQNHTHTITLQNHTHSITLPDHTHEIKHGIFELSTTPSSLVIKVDGNTVSHTSTTGNRINLVDYMAKDSSGKISRGRHELTISPNGHARIEADLILRVFIRSHIGGVY